MMTDYERGRAEGLAEAVKWHEGEISRLKAKRDDHSSGSVIWMAYDAEINEHSLSAEALRALSPSPNHVLVPREPTEEMLEAALDATGDRILPFAAERECGVPVECDISEEDALIINEGTKAAFAEIYRAMIAQVK